jgi:hypothetical protein
MNQQHKVAAAIRQYAEKIAAQKSASDGSPDRMTGADGQGGITTSKGTIPKDKGEAELNVRQPADGTIRTAAQVPAGGPDRLTVADGQGGITATKGTIPKDPGEEELKRDQPADGAVVKGANLSKRAASIRAALVQANPELAKRFAPAQKKVEKQAGASGASAPTLDLSVETLCKIARIIVSSDEGVRLTYDLLEKQAGEEAARAQILEAIQASQVVDDNEQIKQAAFADLQTKVYSIHDALQQANVTEADADVIIKTAAVHQDAISAFAHPLLKSAYAQGMDDAALMTAADEATGEEGVPPVDEALPMGGESLGQEEIMALLQEMLASGQITEQDILEAVAATSGGAGDAEGDAPPVEEEALPPEADAA